MDDENKRVKLILKRPVGAPRFAKFPPEDMIAMGEEMLAWIQENNPYHLSEYYTIFKGFTYEQWKNLIRAAEFVPYYEQAMRIIGMGYLNGRVDKGLSQRWQRVYFKDLKEEEDSTVQDELDRQLDHKKQLIKYEYETKKNDGVYVSVEHAGQFEQLLKVLGKAQEARRIDDNSKSID